MFIDSACSNVHTFLYFYELFLCQHDFDSKGFMIEEGIDRFVNTLPTCMNLINEVYAIAFKFIARIMCVREVVS